jgi:hypothetical protein
VEDVKALGQLVPSHTAFFNCLDSLEGDHLLQGYLFRYNYQTITWQDTLPYLLLQKGGTPCEAFVRQRDAFERIANLNLVEVYKRK